MMTVSNNSTGSNLTWTTNGQTTLGTNGNYYISSGNGWNTLSDAFINTNWSGDDSLTKVILTFLSEAELRDILEKIKNRGASKEEFQDTVREIIIRRHCSEQFILDFFDIQNMDKIIARIALEKMHKADINSGEYAQINLLLQLTELEKN